MHLTVLRLVTHSLHKNAIRWLVRKQRTLISAVIVSSWAPTVYCISLCVISPTHPSTSQLSAVPGLGCFYRSLAESGLFCLEKQPPHLSLSHSSYLTEYTSLYCLFVLFFSLQCYFSYLLPVFGSHVLFFLCFFSFQLLYLLEEFSEEE